MGRRRGPGRHPLDPDFSNAQGRHGRDFHGVAVTYAQVASKPLLHRDRTEAAPHPGHPRRDPPRRRRAVLGRRDPRGVRARHPAALRSPARRSAPTPTRSRSSRTTEGRDGIRRSSADYTYGYGDALRDGVVRPVIFLAYSGEMRWRTKAGDEIAARLGEPLTKDITAQAWRTALDPNGEWIPAVLRAADRRLTEVRRGMPDAGGLVIATDQTRPAPTPRSCERSPARRPSSCCPTTPAPRATSRSSPTGDQRWMVAVRMVSEGVDVPRLAVGVYATRPRRRCSSPRPSAASCGPGGAARPRRCSCRSVPLLLELAARDGGRARPRARPAEADDAEDRMWAPEDELLAAANREDEATGDIDAAAVRGAGVRGGVRPGAVRRRRVRHWRRARQRGGGGLPRHARAARARPGGQRCCVSARRRRRRRPAPARPTQQVSAAPRRSPPLRKELNTPGRGLRPQERRTARRGPHRAAPACGGPAAAPRRPPSRCTSGSRRSGAGSSDGADAAAAGLLTRRVSRPRVSGAAGRVQGTRGRRARGCEPVTAASRRYRGRVTTPAGEPSTGARRVVGGRPRRRWTAASRAALLGSPSTPAACTVTELAAELGVGRTGGLPAARHARGARTWSVGDRGRPGPARAGVLRAGRAVHAAAARRGPARAAPARRRRSAPPRTSPSSTAPRRWPSRWSSRPGPTTTWPTASAPPRARPGRGRPGDPRGPARPAATSPPTASCSPGRTASPHRWRRRPVSRRRSASCRCVELDAIAEASAAPQVRRRPPRGGRRTPALTRRPAPAAALR